MDDYRPEATVAVCKCQEAGEIYGIRFEKTGMFQWKYTWAFPMKKGSARREGYDSTVITGEIKPDMEYPGCPYCGTKTFVVCGKGGKLGCEIVVDGHYTCGWCGRRGVIVMGNAGIQGGGDR